eukprot:c15641_g1_i1.p1 GENE.c15641_g1_i1~~c15641_g1_i1.p1  ORF type:complete len:552 (-),score=164.28 c15641_g1_i1:344-1978(-)
MDGEEEQLKRRLEIEQDLIMEPDGLEVTLKLIRYSPPDKVEEVLKAISKNYRALAQMCNQSVVWLEKMGAPPSQIQDFLTSSLVGLVEQQFDAQKANTLLRGEQPAWLGELINDSQSRAMIYRLSEQHQNCRFLEFMLQILSQQHSDELAAVRSVAKNFELFCGMMSKHIKGTWALPPDPPTNSLDDFKNVCARTEMAYVYTQMMLHQLELQSLALSPSAATHFRRLGHELEGHALTNGVNDNAIHIWKIRMLLAGGSNADETRALGDVLVEGTLSQATILTLHKLYTASPMPSPSSLLRHPSVLERLVGHLYTPGNKMDQEYTNMCVEVLAVAATIIDPNSQEQQRDMVQCEQAIRATQVVCCRVPSDTRLTQDALILKQHFRVPVVSAGIIRWIWANLTDNHAKHLDALIVYPIFLELLRHILVSHPLHCEAVLDVFKWLMTHHHNKRVVLDHMLLMIQCGHVASTLAYIGSWSRDASRDLVLYFFQNLFDMVQEPSPWMRKQVLDVLAFAHIQDALEGPLVIAYLESLNSPDAEELISLFR